MTMKSNFRGLKLVLCAFIAVLVGSCSKDNLNGSLEPTSAKSDIFQPDHFSIADQGEKIVISWHSNLFKDEKASYVIKIERTNIESVLGKEAGKLTLNRSMDFYGKKVLLSVITKDGRSIKIDSLVYTNNYYKFFTSNNKFMAHRGLSSLYPENTAMAFEKAADSGFEYVECDVWLTKDKQWVLCHDETIDRTSNGKGKISDYTLEELLQFDFGFSKKFNGKYTQKIMTLEEFCLISKRQNFKTFIEIKCAATSDQLTDLIRISNRYLTFSEFVITSFFLTILENCRRISPEVIICLNTIDLNFLNNIDQFNKIYPFTINFKVESIYDGDLINTKRVSLLNSTFKNSAVFPVVWTVNSSTVSRQILSFLDCLILTDNSFK